MRGVKSFPKFFNSRFVLIIEGCIVLFLLISVAQEISHRQNVQDEVSRLEQRIATLKQNNVALADVLGDIMSDSFVDKEARQKLDLQKPNETVVLLPREDGGVDVQDTGNNTQTHSPDSSNAEKWWEYFFPSV